MSQDASTPRLVYRGAPDEKGSYESAETATAVDADDLAAKLKAGYRLQRTPKAAENVTDEPKGKK
jgi:hypothetical protein